LVALSYQFKIKIQLILMLNIVKCFSIFISYRTTNFRHTLIKLYLILLSNNLIILYFFYHLNFRINFYPHKRSVNKTITSATTPAQKILQSVLLQCYCTEKIEKSYTFWAKRQSFAPDAWQQNQQCLEWYLRGR